MPLTPEDLNAIGSILEDKVQKALGQARPETLAGWMKLQLEAIKVTNKLEDLPKKVDAVIRDLLDIDAMGYDTFRELGSLSPEERSQYKLLKLIQGTLTPSSLSPPRETQVVCFQCGKPGHYATGCPSRPQREPESRPATRQSSRIPTKWVKKA